MNLERQLMKNIAQLLPGIMEEIPAEQWIHQNINQDKVSRGWLYESGMFFVFNLIWDFFETFGFD